jgi:protein involved in polysaccharide export with SLBB domain
MQLLSDFGVVVVNRLTCEGVVEPAWRGKDLTTQEGYGYCGQSSSESVAAIDITKGVKMKTFMLVVSLSLGFFVGSCAPNRVTNPAPSAQVDQQARTYPQKEYQARTYPLKEYVITEGDVLDIKFKENPEFNELGLPVRPDGCISLQLAQDIKAVGLTPGQLRDVLMKVYATELKNPELTVIVRGFSAQKVFVDGEVGSPRLLDLRGPTTVWSAIIQAGGVRETARLSTVIVIRKDLSGKPQGTSIDLRKVIDGTDFSQDIYLMPYDIVYVPKSNIARVNKFVDEYITKIIPGLGTLSPYQYYSPYSNESRSY